MTSSASPYPRSDYDDRQCQQKRSEEAQESEKMKKSDTNAALPTLPVELWLDILQHATFVPGILEPDVYHQTGTQLTHPDRQHRIALGSLPTKRSLILVCKKWRSLCIPLLYQSIVIKSSRCTELLAVTLTKSHDECSSSDVTSARSLGSFTVRLDLSCAGHNYMGTLRSIMLCLPNLSILSISHTIIFADSQRIIDNILSCALPLRVIDFRRCLTDSRDLERLLKNSPHLRMLQYRDGLSQFATNDNLVTHPVGNTVVMPNITHLSIYGSFRDDGVCSYFTFPSLRELSCDLGTIPSARSVQELFFGKHGYNLTSLDIRRYRSTPADFTRDLLWIKQHCPTLRDLSFWFRDCEDLPVDPVNIPAIELLGLRYDSRDLDFRHLSFLFRFLESLNETSSTLQAVRFLDPVSLSDMLVRENFTTLWGTLSSVANFAWKTMQGALWKNIYGSDHSRRTSRVCRVARYHTTANWSVMDSAKSSNCGERHSKSLRMQAGLVAVTVTTPLEITTARIYAALVRSQPKGCLSAEVLLLWIVLTWSIKHGSRAPSPRALTQGKLIAIAPATDTDRFVARLTWSKPALRYIPAKNLKARTYMKNAHKG
ncbi:hypothetical protein PAXINDRAFT_97169 [Paxillus involutus ATCC 200175]|nr:hypothetical protein PAXINDRAFT_97169 [Paxillus involutus ATCC 200175]